jgi:hypothetical protein
LNETSFKKNASLVFLALMVAASMFSALTTNVKAGNGAAMSIIPAANTFNVLTTPVNSTFNVNATVTNVTLLWNWQINVTFDPSMLNCISAGVPVDSPFYFQVQSLVVIDNVAGYVQFGASQITGPGVNGSGVLGTITFNITRAPSTPGGTLSCGINFSSPYGADTFLNDPDMALIPATFTGATFEYVWVPNYTLTISATAGGTTDPATGSYSYVAGTNVTVTASPSAGYNFGRWLLDGASKTDNPINVTMDANHTLEAVFEDVTPPTIVKVMRVPSTFGVPENEAVSVLVNATDLGSGVKNVTLVYTTDNWTTSESLDMNFSASTGLWEAEIPSEALGKFVQYKIVAYDNVGNSATDSNDDYIYWVIPEFTALGVLLILPGATLSALVLTKKPRKPKAHT